MKKIALLFTILCAGVLNGMEVTRPAYGHYILWEDIPADIKSLIVMYLHKSDTLKNVIYNIKKASLIDKELNILVNKMYGNQKGFTALMHILANKFDETTKSIAKKFGTPAAKAYLDLAEQLDIAMFNADFNTAMQLIQKGADVHYPAELIVNILSTQDNSYENIDNVINALKETSKTNNALHKMINEEYGDQQGFTILINTLGNMFGTELFEILWRFDTPASNTYNSLGRALKRAVYENDIAAATQLIEQGADVNYHDGNNPWFSSTINGYTVSYLHATAFDWAVMDGRAGMAQLLLNAGAVSQPNEYYAEHGYFFGNVGYVTTEEDIEKEQENREKIREMIDEQQSQLIQLISENESKQHAFGTDPLDEFPEAKNIVDKYQQSFAILGLPNYANQVEIKNAYFELARRWHPDKSSDKSIDEQKYAESVFKLIQNAYDTVSGK